MIIYKVTNKQNNKCYIGQTSENICKRFCGKKFGHYTLAFKFNSKTHFHGALRKWGISNFDIEILEDNLTKDNINEKEIFWINYYDSFNKGYNQTTGGSKNRILGEKAKLNISNGTKEGMSKFKLTEGYFDWCSNISKRNKEKPVCKAWSKGLNKNNNEILFNMSKKLSKQRKGEGNSMYGKSVYSLWVEKYGKEEADIRYKSMNDKRSKSSIGKVSPLKNKTWEEAYGKEQAEGMKKYLSDKLKGKNGKHVKGRRHINNGIKSKMVTLEELDSYLEKGWSLGRINLK